MPEQILFVTSFNQKGFDIYGQKMVSTFCQAGVGRLLVYMEDGRPKLPKGCEWRNLTRTCHFTQFEARWRDDPRAHGNVPHESWRDRERKIGHSFRTDAWKFFRKTFAIRDAAIKHRNQYEYLIWMDGDTFTTSKPPETWWNDVVLRGADVVYLGREGYHSECGFVAFKLATTIKFIERWAGWYSSGMFIDRESHDSKLFDDTREMFPKLNYRDISPVDRRYGGVFNKSLLHHHFLHNKGKAKYQE